MQEKKYDLTDIGGVRSSTSSNKYDLTALGPSPMDAPDDVLDPSHTAYGPFRRFLESAIGKPYPEQEGLDIAGGLGAMSGPGVGAVLGGPGGAVIGKGAQNIVQMIAHEFDPTIPPVGPFKAAVSPAAEGLLQEFGPSAIKGVATGTRKLGGALFDAAAKTISGISQHSLDLMESNAPQVIKYARMGVDEAKSVAMGAAKKFQNSISAYVDAAGKQYKKLIEAELAKTPTLRIDLQQALKGTIDAIREDFGYPVASGTKKAAEIAKGTIERIVHPDEVAAFNEFTSLADKLTNATPQQVYFFQKDINAAIRRNYGKPVAAALAQLRDETMQTLDNVLPNISKANAIYRKAMEFETDLKGLSSADNPLTKLVMAARKGTNLQDVVDTFRAASPEAGGLVDEAIFANAGAEFAPAIANLPRTGLTTGLGLGAVGATGSPAVAAGAIATLPFLSPRLVGELGAAGPAVLSAIHAAANSMPGDAFIRALLASHNATGESK